MRPSDVAADPGVNHMSSRDMFPTYMCLPHIICFVLLLVCAALRAPFLLPSLPPSFPPSSVPFSLPRSLPPSLSLSLFLSPSLPRFIPQTSLTTWPSARLAEKKFFAVLRWCRHYCTRAEPCSWAHVSCQATFDREHVLGCSLVAEQ